MCSRNEVERADGLADSNPPFMSRIVIGRARAITMGVLLYLSDRKGIAWVYPISTSRYVWSHAWDPWSHEEQKQQQQLRQVERHAVSH